MSDFAAIFKVCALRKTARQIDLSNSCPRIVVAIIFIKGLNQNGTSFIYFLCRLILCDLELVN